MQNNKVYDFTDAEQGKFYVPIEELDITIYLDEEVKRFFLKYLKNKDVEFSLSFVLKRYYSWLFIKII